MFRNMRDSDTARGQGSKHDRGIAYLADELIQKVSTCS